MRLYVAIAWLLATETLVLAGAALPVLVLWMLLRERAAAGGDSVPWLMALAILPGLVTFGLLLLVLSAGATRLMRWRTPADASLILGELEWPLLRWGCYAACTHVATILAGSWLRGSPVWTWYLRANGAAVGRGVYVNSLNVFDHNLLSFADGAVIGSGVHLSGHTVEHGRLVTGRVRVGARATLGVQCVVGIDVQVGDGTHVGALSLVPKHARLEAGAAYCGVPARRVEPRGAARPP